MRESDVTKPPLVVCVVVNWNNWQDTTECLRSLQEQDYKNIQVIVVDNGSSDDSVTRLRTEFPLVLIVENGYNAGFPKACNVGARLGLAMGAEFVWLLNNDTVLPEHTTATRLVDKAIENPGAGIVGAVLYFMHDPSHIQAWGGGCINLWSGYTRHFIAPEKFGPNCYLTFASALIRRKLYEDLGGLNEDAFMYFEDADFGLRAQRMGWDLCVAEDTVIWHKEGGSFDDKRNPVLERIVTVAGLKFLQRHATIPLVAMTLFLASKIAKRMFLGEWASLKGVLLGGWDCFKEKDGIGGAL
jgi:GT2 family glycosyltransferase